MPSMLSNSAKNVLNNIGVRGDFLTRFVLEIVDLLVLSFRLSFNGEG